MLAGKRELYVYVLLSSLTRFRPYLLPLHVTVVKAGGRDQNECTTFSAEAMNNGGNARSRDHSAYNARINASAAEGHRKADAAKHERDKGVTEGWSEQQWEDKSGLGRGPALGEGA